MDRFTLQGQHTSLYQSSLFSTHKKCSSCFFLYYDIWFKYFLRLSVEIKTIKESQLTNCKTFKIPARDLKYWKPVSAISNLQRVCTQVDCEMGLIRVWNYTLSTVYIDLGLWVHRVSILRMKYFAVIVGKCFVFSASSLDSDLFNCYKSQSEYPLKMSFEIIQTDTERKGSCVANCFLNL